MTNITIYEDNAGGLHISDGTTRWATLRVTWINPRWLVTELAEMLGVAA